MGTILLIILILLLIGALPRWPYSTGWGYYPVGGLGLLLIIILILVLLGAFSDTRLNVLRLAMFARFSLSPLIAICGSAQSCCVRASAADCPFNFLQNRANHANRCAVLIGKRFDGQIMDDEIIKTQALKSNYARSQR